MSQNLTRGTHVLLDVCVILICVFLARESKQHSEYPVLKRQVRWCACVVSAQITSNTCVECVVSWDIQLTHVHMLVQHRVYVTHSPCVVL